MYYLNEFDVQTIVHAAERRPDQPNRLKGAATLARLVDWTNANSDGWAYWAKPQRAAERLCKLLERHTPAFVRHELLERGDITDAQLMWAFTPIKSFLTRHGIDHKEVFK